MSFLDDVLSGVETAAGTIKRAKSAVDSFSQMGTDPRPPSVAIAAQESSGMSTMTWVLIGLGAAGILYLVLRK